MSGALRSLLKRPKGLSRFESHEARRLFKSFRSKPGDFAKCGAGFEGTVDITMRHDVSWETLD